MVKFNKGTNNFNSRLKYDPIENDPKVSAIILKSEIQAEALLREKGVKRQLGYCHILWGIKQKILKEKYNIDWKTPAEMNPDIMFD